MKVIFKKVTLIIFESHWYNVFAFAKTITQNTGFLHSTITLSFLCEFYTGNRQRRKRCNPCSSCKAKDCGKCTDKVKYEGSGKLKQCCIKSKCIKIASKTTAKSGNYIICIAYNVSNQPDTDWHG